MSDAAELSTAAPSVPIRYVLYGAYGGVNAGDEMILHAVAAGISELHPGCCFSVLPFGAHLGEGAAQRYAERGWRLLTRSRPREVLNALAQSTLVVGGGQLINGRHIPKSLAFMCLMMMIAKLYGRRVVMIGIGSRRASAFFWSRQLTRLAIALSDFVGVRDFSTLRELRFLSRNSAKVQLTADVVWSVPQRSKEGPRKIVALAVHRDPGELHLKRDDYLKILAAMADTLTEFEIVVTAHDWRSSFDGGLVDELEGLGRWSTRKFYSASDAADFYVDAEVVVSSRMHPLIIGIRCGARIVPVAASTKVLDMASAVGVETISADMAIEQLSASIIAAVRAEVLPDRKSVIELTSRSRENFMAACGELT